MALLKWILALPFIIGAVLFALTHPDHVDIRLNPFGEPLSLPLYFVSLSFLAVGFILGALMAWVGMSATRKDRRAFKKQTKILTKEKDALIEEIATLKNEVAQHKNEAAEVIEVKHG